jgi:hypothetical protein
MPAVLVLSDLCVKRFAIVSAGAESFVARDMPDHTRRRLNRIYILAMFCSAAWAIAVVVVVLQRTHKSDFPFAWGCFCSSGMLILGLDRQRRALTHKPSPVKGVVPEALPPLLIPRRNDLP